MIYCCCFNVINYFFRVKKTQIFCVIIILMIILEVLDLKKKVKEVLNLAKVISRYCK